MRRAAWLVAALAVSSCGGAPAPAPVVPAAQTTTVVIAEPAGTATALALVVPGTGTESASTSGLMLLAARAVLEDVQPTLVALGAGAEVSCGRWATVLEVVAPAGTWREAVEVVISGIRRGAVSSAALERARARLGASLSLDVANPAWQARLAAGRALYAPAGEGSGWAAPGCGVVEMLPLFDSAAVAGAAGRLLDVTSAALVGPVDSTAGPWVDALLGDPGARAGRPEHPAPGRAGAGRVYVERNTVTAWLSVAWPFEADRDPDALRVLGAVLEERHGPSLSRPGVLHATSEVELHGDGGALVVTVVVAPGEAAELAAAMEEEVRRIAAGMDAPGLIRDVAREQRGTLARGLAAPEDRAARIAVAAAAGTPLRPWPAWESFTEEAVRSAAAGLGAPARAVVGPRESRGAVVP